MAINLLPWREQKIRQYNRNFLFLLLAGVCLVGILTLVSHLYLYHLQNTQKYNNQHIDHIIRTFPPLPNKAQIKLKFDTRINQLKLLHDVLLQQSLLWESLIFLQQTLPEEVHLNNLDWSNQQLKLQGYTEHVEKISAWFRQLQQKKLFSQIKLIKFEQTADNLETKFIIQIPWNLHLHT